MNIKLLSYNKFSSSCKELKQALLARGVKRVLTVENTNYVAKKDFCVVWGDSSKARIFDGESYDNHPKILLNKNVSNTIINKLDFFTFLKSYKVWHQYIPNFVHDKLVLPSLFQAMKGKEKIVVCRTKLSASGGEGIVLIDESTPEGEIPNCKLYVEYIKKQDEFRVHVFQTPENYSHNILVQKKLRRRARLEEGTVNYKVRNLENGWIYEKLDEHPIPPTFIQFLTDVTQQLRITFAAYDIIYNAAKDKYYILEANTAPGISHDTVDFYADNIMAWYDRTEDTDITSVE